MGRYSGFGQQADDEIAGLGVKVDMLTAQVADQTAALADRDALIAQLRDQIAGLQGLTHPGAVYWAAQLGFVAGQIKAGAQPWTGEVAVLKSRRANYGANLGYPYCDLTWVPAPRAEVGRGSGGSPDQGGWDLLMDATAALVDAQLWALTGDRDRASKAASILNAWAVKITRILFDTTTWSDGKLLAGWVGSLLGRAVELLKHTGYVPGVGETVPNWAAIDRMLRDVILPRVTEWHTGSGGNWIASFVDATVQLGVALDDRAVFQLGVDRWRRVVPSLFFMPGDQQPASRPQLAGLPLVPPWTMWDTDTVAASTVRSIWGNPTSWPAGLEFETFRDTHHMAMSFAAVANAAETAWHQGVDLWGEEQARIVAAAELAAGFVYDAWVRKMTRPTGWPYATDVKGYATSTQRATWTILWNHYANRCGVAMPNTKRLLDEYVWPSTWIVDLHIVAEQLTHYSTP